MVGRADEAIKKLFIIAFVLFLGVWAQTPAYSQEEKPQKRTPVVFIREQKPPRLMLGSMIGFPTGLSLIGAWYADPFAVRLSGGVSMSGFQGAQADISHLVWRLQSSRHDVSLTGGIFRFEEINSSGISDYSYQTYIGSAYTVLYDGFHIQLGFAYGIEDYSHFVLLFQAGYMFKIM